MRAKDRISLSPADQKHMVFGDGAAQTENKYLLSNATIAAHCMCIFFFFFFNLSALRRVWCGLSHLNQ